ncbi:hypothetical protein ACLBXM_02225 [Xanthobacteraceae bacterium A53D]
MVVAALAAGGAIACGCPSVEAQQLPASPASLQLTADAVQTDPAGAFVNVRVKNVGSAVISQIEVGCRFLAGGKAIGESSTTLYASVPGVTGIGQVRLLGATGATSARCGIHKLS